jgi:MoxR-like ATPase
MQEYQVSAGGKTHMLPLPFLVFATQNPIEQEGTYPLPEAQLDRFMFHLQVDYPSPEDEIQIATYSPHLNPVVVEPVLDAAAILRFQELVGRVPVSEEAVAYAVSLVRRSRPQDSSSPSYIKEFLHWGAGPRASQFLVLAGQSRALLDGRFVVGIEDIRSVAVPTMRHRLVTNFHADARGVLRDDIVRRLLDEM